jgi:hypothetical protein
VLILLVAAAPPYCLPVEGPRGVAHDEVANWLIAKSIPCGHYAIDLAAAYGHEPPYRYLEAVAVALFGYRWVGLRCPPAALELVALAVT